jgi:hypothetical protein
MKANELVLGKYYKNRNGFCGLFIEWSETRKVLMNMDDTRITVNEDESDFIEITEQELRDKHKR